jgi:hypothetical protein
VFSMSCHINMWLDHYSMALTLGEKQLTRILSSDNKHSRPHKQPCGVFPVIFSVVLSDVSLDILSDIILSYRSMAKRKAEKDIICANNSSMYYNL